MKVISFSLWGDNSTYTRGALKNSELAESLYPGWECWFYVGTSCPERIIKSLEEKSNTKVIRMEEEGDWTGMFWRFLPASDSSVEVMISRDTDSRLSMREKEAVDSWLSSDLSFHIMRDHPYHGVPILGGMWGAKRGVLSDMKDLLDQTKKDNYWQIDQEFLKEYVYERVKRDALVHDEFFEKNPFPSTRTNKYFVGMAFDENDIPLHPEHMELIK